MVCPELEMMMMMISIIIVIPVVIIMMMIIIIAVWLLVPWGWDILHHMYVNPKSNPNCSMLNSSMGVGDIMSCAPQMNPNSGTGTVWSTHVHLVRFHWCLHYSVRGASHGVCA
jgi:hypothetical protein